MIRIPNGKQKRGKEHCGKKNKPYEFCSQIRIPISMPFPAWEYKPTCTLIKGHKISDLAFAGFLNKVEYLAGNHGKKMVKVNRWKPSSKTCSRCGHKEDKMPLDMRRWTCPECGAHHDRDVNAAKNILQVGTSTLKGEIVNQL
ncbi:RNA-guided endonuclease InsQ/TnpB family protein [Parabacteroides sp. APC149_11_2_Y6]